MDNENIGFLQSVIDALGANIAILDEQGFIIKINKAWRQFASENDFRGEDAALGQNYLQICKVANPVTEPEGFAVAQAIRAAIGGAADEFQLVYPCHSPHQQRWFEIRITSFIENGRMRVVTAHENVTHFKLIEETLRQKEVELARRCQDLRHMANLLANVQQEERRSMARELHDDFSQRMAMIALDAGGIESILHNEAHPSAARLHELRDKLVWLSEAIHDFSRQLHPSIIDDLGLVDAVASECAAFQRRVGVRVRFVSRDVPDHIPSELAYHAYRIIQEGLQNIARHSGIDSADVELAGHDDQLTIQISDKGVGFDPNEPKRKAAIGLASMGERVRLLNGRFVIQARPGQGVTIQAIIPLARRQS